MFNGKTHYVYSWCFLCIHVISHGRLKEITSAQLTSKLTHWVEPIEHFNYACWMLFFWGTGQWDEQQWQIWQETYKPTLTESHIDMVKIHVKPIFKGWTSPASTHMYSHILTPCEPALSSRLAVQQPYILSWLRPPNVTLSISIWGLAYIGGICTAEGP